MATKQQLKELKTVIKEFNQVMNKVEKELKSRFPEKEDKVQQYKNFVRAYMKDLVTSGVNQNNN